MKYGSEESITVLRNVLDNEIFSAFLKYSQGGENNVAEFLHKIYEENCENDFLGYIQNLILTDENVFAKSCARDVEPSRYITAAYRRDLEIIFGLVLDTDTQGMYGLGKCTDPFDENFNLDATCLNLKNFYRRYGYGKFIKNSAFFYENGDLIPVSNPSPIRISELKDYCYEKKLIQSNLENFVRGLPFSDMLLYGDKGTGKSSTIHAMLNNYFDNGLRLIELNKENMLQIPKIRQLTLSIPLKFIIFIDDLSLDEGDDKISPLKASLEGSVCGGTDNTMIVATSNRRHIVKESFSDRENSVHANDSIQEQLSLSDRFGLTVLFSSTDKAAYLSIVRQLAADARLAYDDNQLCSTAERWALVKGGRSPRRAKQLIDLLYSCQVKGEQIDF